MAESERVGGYQTAPVNYDNIDASGAGLEQMESQPKRRQMTILGRVLDYDLLVAKGFYFFFYAAFGSLFPLIAIYFKQQGMNATQAGFLIGIRPFIEYASTPFWSSFADRFRKGKILLLFSICAWIFFTLALSWIQPGTPYCLSHNKTAFFLSPARVQLRSKRSVSEAAFSLPSSVTKGGDGRDVFYLQAMDISIDMDYLFELIGQLQMPGTTTNGRLKSGKVFAEGPGRPDEVPQKVMDANTAYVDTKLAETAKAGAPAPVDLTNINGPKWFGVLRTFGTPHYAAFLFVTWWMGFGVGLVFSFLFWHLQDLGGSPSLFGVASVINHVSEVAAYFFSFRLINRIGHVKVMYVGLIANAFRFLYVSWLSNPWWVLPFEFVQGISHAAVWAAATSYISLAAPPEQKAQAQGILQGLHHGFGKGCGALIGGIVITYKGTRAMFVSYSVLCLLFYLMFMVVNRFFKPNITIPLDHHEEQPTLAPHGVPTFDVKLNDKFNQRPDVGYQNAPAPDPQQFRDADMQDETLRVDKF